MAYIEPKTNREIQDKIVAILQTTLPDPYLQAKGSVRPVGEFIYGDDFNLNGSMPKIQVKMLSADPLRLGGQSLTTYLEERTVSFAMFYYNQLNHSYTFSATSLTLSNEAQCTEYLELIQDTLKSNMASFSGFFHRHEFGEIPTPVRQPTTSLFSSMLPFSVRKYKR